VVTPLPKLPSVCLSVLNGCLDVLVRVSWPRHHLDSQNMQLQTNVNGLSPLTF